MLMEIVNMPATLKIVPVEQIAASFNCCERTAIARLGKDKIPVVRWGKTRGVFVADMARLISKMQGLKTSPAGMPAAPGQ